MTWLVRLFKPACGIALNHLDLIFDKGEHFSTLQACAENLDSGFARKQGHEPNHPPLFFSAILFADYLRSTFSVVRTTP
jgi:hypothetical protein